jgi:hypothetical protein
MAETVLKQSQREQARHVQRLLDLGRIAAGSLVRDSKLMGFLS